LWISFGGGQAGVVATKALGAPGEENQSLGKTAQPWKQRKNMGLAIHAEAA
jgi:hypothetical protein